MLPCLPSAQFFLSPFSLLSRLGKLSMFSLCFNFNFVHLRKGRIENDLSKCNWSEGYVDGSCSVCGFEDLHSLWILASILGAESIFC